LELLAGALWGTKARAEPERRFAQSWTTRAEVPLRRALAPVQVKMMKAAKAQELTAERWRPEQALTMAPVPKALARMETPQELWKRTPELTEQEPL
jgi:hypothetical protein